MSTTPAGGTGQPPQARPCNGQRAGSAGAADAGLLLRLRRGSQRAFLVQSVGIVLLAAMHLLVARRLPPATYGAFSFGLALATLLATLATLGWPSGLLRFVPEYLATSSFAKLRGVLERSHRESTLVALALPLLVFAATPLCPQHLVAGVRFGACLLPLLALGWLRRAALRGLERITASGLADDVLVPLAAVVAVELAGVTAEGPLLAGYLAIVVVLSLGLGTVWLLMSLPPEVGRIRAVLEAGPWRAVTLPLAVGELAQIALRRAPIVALGLLAPLEQVSHYGIADRMALLVSFPAGAVNTIASPLLASAWVTEGRRGLELVLVRTIRWSALGAAPVFLALVLFPGACLGLVGAPYREASAALRLLACGQFVAAATGSVGPALMLCGRERLYARTVGIVSIANAGSSVLAIRHSGALGAAASTAAALAALNLWHAWLVWRFLREERPR